MAYTLSTAIICATLFVSMLILLELGRRFGARRLAEGEEMAGHGAIDGAVFALMGLLFAFTFSGAASRFDTRRQLIVEETNDIGTAYLRLDLLPASSQPALRDSFRRYIDSRVATYRKLPDIEAAKQELAESVRLQGEIWNQAVKACTEAGSPATTTLVLSALNAMIDITTTRTLATQMHPPPVIFAMLIGISLASALLAGYGMASGKVRSWLHLCSFPLVITLAVFVILDLEYPRLGVLRFRLDAFDQALVDLRESMH